MGIFVYKWLLAVIGEIINRNSIYLLLVAIDYSGRSGTSMRQIEFSHIVYTRVAELHLLQSVTPKRS